VNKNVGYVEYALPTLLMTMDKAQLHPAYFCQACLLQRLSISRINLACCMVHFGKKVSASPIKKRQMYDPVTHARMSRRQLQELLQEAGDM
jgi:hypothetical protein